MKQTREMKVTKMKLTKQKPRECGCSLPLPSMGQTRCSSFVSFFYVDDGDGDGEVEDEEGEVGYWDLSSSGLASLAALALSRSRLVMRLKTHLPCHNNQMRLAYNA